MNKLISLFILSLLVINVFGKIGGKRVLVLLDEEQVKSTHSDFFDGLTKKGYELDFQKTDSKVQLQKYEDFLYDHLIILSVENDPTLTTNEILAFIDGGNNVIIAGSSIISETIRDVASDCGIEIEEDKTAVYDNFNFDKSQNDHSLLLADGLIKDSPIIVNNVKLPILFRGIGHKIRDNVLNYGILTASATAYSGKQSTKAAGKLQGKRVGLVSSLQARNNARVTFSGSLELLSNENLRNTKVSNKEFVEQLTSWTLQERGILRASDLSIVKVNPTSTDNNSSSTILLTVKDDIQYSLKIEEFQNGQWVPFVGKLQLEIICLDPYIRTFIQGNKQGLYQSTIQLPDVYGVFTFEGTVKVPGYGNLQSLVRHPIRPFRHDSYERFIPSAYPYYAASFSMIIGTFIFSIIFLLHRDSTKPTTSN
ncbi:dolichyl-diphosphooligosaccharide-protein glycotransferase [Tieghemostelium lacteum]|uniref:Dolichyl-diphosphooligosaccharide--protein glycosyltransferase 48 kDa subunit n=1 Tax=Tieghemostelium lacteum TaxID=361077 RepID=A0A151Z4A9_TIELA|nr:dolichyl-diphosphooligosaccharide-protein glycotransferase [Tieghemostelium lacteum]|eukprot:KYQ88802.1 dolichyl-diphosphooligosaccharide-protein glycotransferase [Tieghemostelium lacteum]